MALRTPFEFPSNQPEGQRIISVADPIGTAPGASTFYLARRFHFAEGNYTILVHADDAATVWIGTAQLNSRMILSTTLAEPGTAYVNIPLGDYRIDVILQNQPVPPSPCYFDMLIMNGDVVVYSSTVDGWKLDDVPISDDDLPPADDFRFKLPVFTPLPNWATGVLERLNWITDVLSSETDAEQRRSVRRNARRSFEASFGPRSIPGERNRLDTFFVGIGPAQFMLPLWHEGVKMLDGLDMEASGVFFEDGELYAREFRTGDLVFVNSGNPDDYDILQVGDMEQNRFSWAFPPPRSWPRGTRIYPMRLARIGVDQAPRMQNITDRVSTATVRFDLVEPYTVPAAWGGAVDGQPLFRYIPDRSQTLDVEYNRRNYTLDNDSGVPVTVDHGRFTGTQLSMRLFLTSRADAYSFRQFLQSARGQAVHFFMPTFMEDITLLGDILDGDTDVLIIPQGYAQYMLRPQPVRLQLAFQFRNGAPTLYRVVTGVTEVYKTDPDGTVHTPPIIVGELLHMDQPMPDIKLSALRRVSFVSETRFAQDGFELLHSTNQQRAVSTSLVFRQAKNPRIVP